jgi:hypothetical protein
MSKFVIKRGRKRTFNGTKGQVYIPVTSNRPQFNYQWDHKLESLGINLNHIN